MRYAHRLMRGIATRARVLVMLVLVLLIAACDGGTATETTTSVVASPEDSTTTSSASADATSTTSTPETALPDRPTVQASEGLDPAIVEELAAEVEVLIDDTEQIRGLEFLSHPTVTILTTEELAERVEADLEEELVPEELAIETRVYQLLGLLTARDELEDILLDLYSEGVAGFYDGDTGEMVIGGEAAELSPYTKSVIVHELVHALTDQHFVFNDDYQAMFEEERYDEGAAFQALIEGDATYFQLVYFQELPMAEQLAAAMEELDRVGEATSFTTSPRWILNSLSFPYESGRAFVSALVEDGGIAAVDAAYTERPTTTEEIMHPARYESGEGAATVPPIAIELDGYDVYETSSYGEWGIRLLLSNSPAGVAVTAANGWGGDAYQVLTNDSDLVLAMAYKGDTEDDAFELADALIQLVESLDMGEALADGGGVSYLPEDGRYAFLDRIGDGFIFVISTDAAAGAAAADQLTIP